MTATSRQSRWRAFWRWPTADVPGLLSLEILGPVPLEYQPLTGP